MKVIYSFQENGNKASRLFVNLEFQKLTAYLHLLGYYCTLASQDLSVVALYCSSTVAGYHVITYGM